MCDPHKDTVKNNEKESKREKRRCNDFCEYECVLETLGETDPEFCAAHRLGCICCFCCLIRRIKKRKKKTAVVPVDVLEITNERVSEVEINSVPVVIEQPKPKYRHTL